jgi:flagellar hook assembly protein FlgD
VDVAPARLPKRMEIQGLSPNPFTQSTTITLALPQRALSHLVVYDVTGRVVRTLVNGVLEAGIHPIPWNGRSDAGTSVATGVYFAKLESGGLTSARRIVRIK